MTSFFQKPIRQLQADDVLGLVTDACSEGYEVEFKETIPDKRGQPSLWLAGKSEISEYARDNLLAEIVAFANAQGGYLFLGIAETDDKPARAARIVPLPRLGELARRLEDQARACIEPSVPRLEFRPVETGPGEGVLIIYCGGSNRAPHRLSTTSEAFVRRGSSSSKMTMREIQEMSVNVARELDRLPELFKQRSNAFMSWAEKAGEGAAFRISAIPLRRLPDPGRLIGRVDHGLVFKRYYVNFGGRRYDIRVPLTASQIRPILRGVRFYSDKSDGIVTIEQFQSGIVDVWFFNDLKSKNPTNPEEIVLYHSWVIAGAVTSLQILNGLRSLANVPNADYAMEIELVNTSRQHPFLKYRGPENQYGADEYLIRENRLVISDIAVDDPGGFDDVMARVDTDVFDAIGAPNTSRKIVVDWVGI